MGFTLSSFYCEFQHPGSTLPGLCLFQTWWSHTAPQERKQYRIPRPVWLVLIFVRADIKEDWCGKNIESEDVWMVTSPGSLVDLCEPQA
eukprot:3924717-Amphidinium_carterae.3